MSAVREGFEFMDSLGVGRDIQHLFLDVLQEGSSGRLSAAYFGRKGKVVDREILSVGKIKFPSEGILHFSAGSSEYSRTVFISDSLTNLVFFAKHHFKRINFGHSAFVACGARLDQKLFLAALRNYPEAIKYYALFGHSLIGRIKDSKVQHWLKRQDCPFRVDKDEVVALLKGKEYRMPVKEFSLRRHLRQVGLRQTLFTFKPMDKNIDNYYCFNYFRE